jgi:putative transposase
VALEVRLHKGADAKRLKWLEDGNARLKKRLAELMLDVPTLKDLLAKKLLTPGLRRAAAT